MIVLTHIIALECARGQQVVNDNCLSVEVLVRDCKQYCTCHVFIFPWASGGDFAFVPFFGERALLLLVTALAVISDGKTPGVI